MQSSSARSSRSGETPVSGVKKEVLRAPILERLTGFHLRMANLAVYRDFVAATATLQLTQKQYAVLELTAANPGASQTALAQSLGMDRATMMALIDRLQSRTLVERRSPPQDRRRQEIHLTATGHRLLEGARILIAEHEARIFSGWSEQERADLHAVLARLEREGFS